MYRNLTSLKHQISCVIAKIHGTFSEQRSLITMGLKPGNTVMILHRAPFNGDFACEVEGCIIVVSEQLAKLIEI